MFEKRAPRDGDLKIPPPKEFDLNDEDENLPLPQLFRLIKEQKPERADAVVWLEGDRADRNDQCLRLMQSNFADQLVMSGGIDNPSYGSVPAARYVDDFVKAGISRERITLDGATNTKEQAVNVINLAKNQKWEKLILVASPYHQLRALLTFLATLKGLGLEQTIELINVPAELSWFRPAAGRGDRPAIDLLVEEEIPRLIKYWKDGDVALPSEGVEYLKYWQRRKQEEEKK